MDFFHQFAAQRVHFAPGRAAETLTSEVRHHRAERVMVLSGGSSSAVADTVTADLPVTIRLDDAARHVPGPLVDRTVSAARSADVDLVLSVGGGSAVGLAKAVALSTGLPIVALPTTYAGSEATDVWGITSDGVKKTGIDSRVLPASVVYDATLTLGLPVGLSVVSGINALAHCVDALWGPRVSPIDRVLSDEAVRGLVGGLESIMDSPEGLAGRASLQYGAYLSGVVFASAGSGLHHKICHVLGGRFDLPHAETHAAVLPHVVALNIAHAPDLGERLARSLGADSPNAGIAALYTSTGAPHSLRDLGVGREALTQTVDAILAAAPAGNPAPLNWEVIARLLDDAWLGDLPTS